MMGLFVHLKNCFNSSAAFKKWNNLAAIFSGDDGMSQPITIILSPEKTRFQETCCDGGGSFLLTTPSLSPSPTGLTPSPPPPPPPTLSTIMDMRNYTRCNVLTNARVNFSQSETSSFLRGRGGGS